ncbi:MAG: hypothetical protein JXB48_00730, partial [Candidatus Latescibacteria bacterium]|nr:hypothetical protein [Candidatus Latescibacterota bacterium]
MRFISKISLSDSRVITVLCFLFIIMSIHCTGIYASIYVNGFGETGYYPRLNDPGKTVINQQRVRLNMSGSKGIFSYKVWSEAQKNGSGELRPEWELLVPEIFGELNGKSFFVRVGKQQIVWGAADGLFINDVVNPLDLREFLLPDLENIHRAQPSVRLQYRRSDWLAESVWIVKFDETKLPDIMTSNIGNSAMAGVTIPLVFHDSEKPPVTFSNSEFGFRISGLIKQWDISLNYLRSWRDIPTYRGTVNVSETEGPTLIMTPFYQRISSWGGSFSRPLGTTLLRGEFSYIPDLLMETTETDVSKMIQGQDFLTYFLGMDYVVYKARIGFQFAQEIAFGDAELLYRNKVDNVLTLLLERTFLRDTLQCTIFADREFDQDDLWVRTEFGYRMNSKVKVMCGSHIFTGKESGHLGMFHDWSNVFVKLRYSF